MTLTAPPSEIAIIGGGLAGLTLALALHRVQIPCTVYEARSKHHNPGGGLMLSPNALRPLDRLGAYERLRDKALNFDKLYFQNDKDETTDIYYFGSRTLYGYEAMRIMRRELLGELLAMVRERGIPVHFDSVLATVVDPEEKGQKVKFTFTDGRTASASLLVGADGIHSAVRSSLFPDAKPPQYAGILGINCVVERSRLRIPEGYGLPAIAMGKPGGFLLVPQRPDGSELYVGAQRRFPELDEAGWRALRQDRQRMYDMIHEQQSEWPDVVQSALEAMTVDRMGFWAFHGLPPLASWLSDRSGRVILVGDAAHAIPPTVGQGANQAVEDVCALAALLARLSPEVPLDAATRAWQGYRQARVQRILELTSQMNAKRLPEAEKAKLPPGAIWTNAGLTCGEGGELGWLYDVDLEEEVEKWRVASRGS
ncbi:kynurenine 3-monooxygenase [Chaetomium tenue]|uniref:Kynurenine 3-monooxygenase n=1 Tax=Chaetomium tenue TaxID=1854479 RepID=A0ACB7PJG1_9PEZI|nr:kynurenine 3-monooxygenase [Chaetomium globosum]